MFQDGRTRESNSRDFKEGRITSSRKGKDGSVRDNMEGYC